MILRGVVGIAALLLFGGQPVAAEKPEDLALPAAQAWLKLVDAGKYDASWKQGSAIETVTPMLDADGVWRVSGYFIR